MPRRKSIPLDTVLTELKKLYPNADCTLDWSTPLELLVATILAAQCTDARVNIVTKSLFKKYKKAEDYISVPQEELEQDIRSCGTYHMKAKAIQETCGILLEKHNGEVPKTMKEMLELRGVGRKTAAIVLGTAFGVVEGIPIDTHNIRLLQRLGLTTKKTQDTIEKDMMQKTSQHDWITLSHLMVAHGRAVCTARNRACHRCVFKDSCPSSLAKNTSKS